MACSLLSLEALQCLTSMAQHTKSEGSTWLERPSKHMKVLQRLTLPKGQKHHRNVRGRMDQPMLTVTGLSLRDIPINLSALASVYAQVRNTAGRSYSGGRCTNWVSGDGHD